VGVPYQFSSAATPRSFSPPSCTYVIAWDNTVVKTYGDTVVQSGYLILDDNGATCHGPTPQGLAQPKSGLGGVRRDAVAIAATVQRPDLQLSALKQSSWSDSELEQKSDVVDEEVVGAWLKSVPEQIRFCRRGKNRVTKWAIAISLTPTE
jgi:hypothetical protein